MIALKTLEEMYKKSLMLSALERLEGTEAYLSELEALYNEYEYEFNAISSIGMTIQDGHLLELHKQLEKMGY